MADALVRWELLEGGVGLVTIDRPPVNALNAAVLQALGKALGELGRSGALTLVVTGAGSRAFVAGADIAAMAEMHREQAESFARAGQRILSRLAEWPGVSIAAVSGFALGGGMELAMACDLIVADPSAVFGQPEVGLGVIPGFGGTQRLVRRVGLQRAVELCTTGRNVLAEEALRLGIVLEVTEPGGAVQRALAIARQIGSKGPLAVRRAKRACGVAVELDIVAGLQEEAELFGRCFETADQREGMAAFLQKRPPQFTGR